MLSSKGVFSQIGSDFAECFVELRNSRFTVGIAGIPYLLYAFSFKHFTFETLFQEHALAFHSPGLGSMTMGEDWPTPQPLPSPRSPGTKAI